MKIEPRFTDSSVTEASEFENNPLFTFTLKQLEPIFKTWIFEVLQNIQPPKEETTQYLTRLQTCEILKISLPTLTRYSKLGLIPEKKIGNRILYLQSDVEASLKDRPISNK